MIGLLRKLKQFFVGKSQQQQEDETMEVLCDPAVFSDQQRTILKALFPKEWTHIDNFSQDEIFKIAVTLTLFGLNCDTIEKLQGAMSLLHLQDICTFDANNPDLVKRA